MIKSDKHRAWFIFLLAIAIGLGWRLLAGTLALSWQNDDYTHILVILPVSAALILSDRKHIFSTSEWNFGSGPLILILATVLACGAQFWPVVLPKDEKLFFGMFVLVLSWVGIFVICFGRKACGRALFPLLFLFALAPLPTIALNWVIALLQRGSAWSTHALYAIAGVPVIQQGNQLAIPGLIVNIAKECSSIRSSSMLAVTTIVLAFLLLRSPWRRIFIIALVIPLSVAKNGLRIFTITMLGTRVDPGYLNGRLHHQGGILFFIVALVAVFAILIWLGRGEGLAQVPQAEPLQDTVTTR